MSAIMLWGSNSNSSMDHPTLRVEKTVSLYAVHQFLYESSRVYGDKYDELVTDAANMRGDNPEVADDLQQQAQLAWAARSSLTEAMTCVYNLSKNMEEA